MRAAAAAAAAAGEAAPCCRMAARSAGGGRRKSGSGMARLWCTLASGSTRALRLLALSGALPPGALAVAATIEGGPLARLNITVRVAVRASALASGSPPPDAVLRLAVVVDSLVCQKLDHTSLFPRAWLFRFTSPFELIWCHGRNGESFDLVRVCAARLSTSNTFQGHDNISPSSRNEPWTAPLHSEFPGAS
jgi:hypothetical protein